MVGIAVKHLEIAERIWRIAPGRLTYVGAYLPIAAMES